MKEPEVVKIFTGHSGAVVDLKFASDSSVLISAGEGSSLHMWDMQELRLVKEVKSKPFSPHNFTLLDDRLVAWHMSSQGRVINFWDLSNSSGDSPTSSERTIDIKRNLTIDRVFFSPSGACLAGSISFGGVFVVKVTHPLKVDD
jgi:WD40 repeat protein